MTPLQQIFKAKIQINQILYHFVLIVKIETKIITYFPGTLWLKRNIPEFTKDSIENVKKIIIPLFKESQTFPR